MRHLPQLVPRRGLFGLPTLSLTTLGERLGLEKLEIAGRSYGRSREKRRGEGQEECVKG